MRQNTVLIAEDHTIAKEGLIRLLEQHDSAVVDAVGDGHLLSTRPSGFDRTSSSRICRCRG